MSTKKSAVVRKTARYDSKKSIRRIFAAAVAATAILGVANDAASMPQVPPSNPYDRPGLAQLEREWRQSAKDICVVPGHEAVNASDAQIEVARALYILQQVPLGKALVEQARDAGVLACIAEQFGSRGYYDNEARVLAVKPDVEFWQKVIIFAHELEHANQHAQGFKRTLDYSMEEAVRFTFVLEADAQAIATLLAWQLKEAGYNQAWDAVKSFTKYKEATNAFESNMIAAQKSGRPIDAQRYRLATQAAFKGWMQSKWLTDNYRFQALVMYTDELDETKRIQSYKPAPAHYYDRLGQVGDFSYNLKSVLPTHEQVMTPLVDPEAEKKAADARAKSRQKNGDKSPWELILQ